MFGDPINVSKPYHIDGYSKNKGLYDFSLIAVVAKEFWIINCSKGLFGSMPG